MGWAYNKIAVSAVNDCAGSANNPIDEWEKVTDYSGEILLSTRWAQESDGKLVFNTYCPIDTTTGGRSLVGCVALMHAQILYYWAERGADLSLTLTSADAYRTVARQMYISGEADSTYDYGVFSVITDKLVEISVGNADDVAAFTMRAYFRQGKFCPCDLTNRASTPIVLLS